MRRGSQFHGKAKLGDVEAFIKDELKLKREIGLRKKRGSSKRGKLSVKSEE